MLGGGGHAHGGVHVDGHDGGVRHGGRNGEIAEVHVGGRSHDGAHEPGSVKAHGSLAGHKVLGGAVVVQAQRILGAQGHEGQHQLGIALDGGNVMDVQFARGHLGKLLMGRAVQSAQQTLGDLTLAGAHGQGEGVVARFLAGLGVGDQGVHGGGHFQAQLGIDVLVVVNAIGGQGEGDADLLAVVGAQIQHGLLNVAHEGFAGQIHNVAVVIIGAILGFQRIDVHQVGRGAVGDAGSQAGSAVGIEGVFHVDVRILRFKVRDDGLHDFLNLALEANELNGGGTIGQSGQADAQHRHAQNQCNQLLHRCILLAIFQYDV